ncbi:MAG: sugar phosphate isomerase/epimerase family protein [Acutalibacteraceae bacterium]
MEIGAQFYTLRDFCKDTDSFAETLKKVADIGYKTVQISGTCQYDPKWLQKQLKKNGLRCVLTHTPADKLQNDPAKVAAEHDVFDCKYVGLGWFGFDEEKHVDDFIRDYTPVAEALSQNGKYFMYHNHDGEFKKFNGRLVLETLAENISPKIMGFTLDTFWVQAGGGDPAHWIERLSGRVPCIHLKDYAFGRKMAPIGEGNINFDRVFEKAESAGTEYMLVEQDVCNGEDPFECLKRSFNNLRSFGFK